MEMFLLRHVYWKYINVRDSDLRIILFDVSDAKSIDGANGVLQQSCAEKE